MPEPTEAYLPAFRRILYRIVQKHGKHLQHGRSITLYSYIIRNICGEELSLRLSNGPEGLSRFPGNFAQGKDLPA